MWGPHILLVAGSRVETLEWVLFYIEGLTGLDIQSRKQGANARDRLDIIVRVKVVITA